MNGSTQKLFLLCYSQNSTCAISWGLTEGLHCFHEIPVLISSYYCEVNHWLSQGTAVLNSGISLLVSENRTAEDGSRCVITTPG